MIKILLCCGGGFSSSAIAQRMKKEIIKRGIEKDVYIEFYPFTIAKEKYLDFDILMCCPHLKMYVPQFLQDTNLAIPLYILPPRMYGLMDIEEVLLDAKNCIDIYKRTNSNPVFFPGEENILKSTRIKAYEYHN